MQHPLPCGEEHVQHPFPCGEERVQPHLPLGEEHVQPHLPLGEEWKSPLSLWERVGVRAQGMSEPMQPKTLLIGFGNLDRQDDGVAWHILARIAQQLGIPVCLDPDLGCELDTPLVDLRFMLQLTPEITESMAAYARICFIDACAYPLQKGVSLVQLEAQYQPSPMTHHMTPETCLSICQVLYNKQPQAVLLTTAAHEFGFSRSLSPQTSSLVDQAVDQLQEWLSTPLPAQSNWVAELQI